MRPCSLIDASILLVLWLMMFAASCQTMIMSPILLIVRHSFGSRSNSSAPRFLPIRLCTACGLVYVDPFGAAGWSFESDVVLASMLDVSKCVPALDC